MKEKKSQTTILAAGTLAALGASLCCITPVLAVLAGIGGLTSTFSWLDPFRPFFIGLTLLVLSFAWYMKLKPRKEDIDCACEEDKDQSSFLKSKKFLAIVTALAFVLLAFPFYAQSLFPEKLAQQKATIDQPVLHQVRIDIKGMTCAGCENSVNYALGAKIGVVKAEASYEEGTAHISYDPAIINPEALTLAIEEELGYEVTNLKILNK